MDCRLVTSLMASGWSGDYDVILVTSQYSKIVSFGNPRLGSGSTVRVDQSLSTHEWRYLWLHQIQDGGRPPSWKSSNAVFAQRMIRYTSCLVVG